MFDMKNVNMKLGVCLAAILLMVVLGACRNDASSSSNTTPVLPEVSTAAPVATAETQEPETAVPPTPTTEPLAAIVNNEPIPLALYEQEVARYEQAQTDLGLGNSSTNYREVALNTLIDRVLIAQAAQAEGISITPEMVDQKLAELRNEVGDNGNFEAWLQANLWTEEEFRQALADQMLVEQMVTVVTADVPLAVEQVHARYIQVDDLALAQSLLERINNGEDFAALAREFSLDRVTAENGGDLGFFARGSLLVPEVEAAAFALQPGEVSEIISVTDATTGQTTYYLVQVIERDPERPLSANMRYLLLQQAFEEWLQSLREQAEIIVLIDTESGG